jgi:hypothetical protein
LSFLERNAMLDNIGSGFAPIPGKRDVAHSIILAICQRRWRGCVARLLQLVQQRDFFDRPGGGMEPWIGMEP